MNDREINNVKPPFSEGEEGGNESQRRAWTTPRITRATLLDTTHKNPFNLEITPQSLASS